MLTLRTVEDTFHIREFVERRAPKSAVVVGGGYIGLEMAENLIRLGVQVTILEMAEHVLAPLDYDMACEVHALSAQQGRGAHAAHHRDRLFSAGGTGFLSRFRTPSPCRQTW